MAVGRIPTPRLHASAPRPSASYKAKQLLRTPKCPLFGDLQVRRPLPKASALHDDVVLNERQESAPHRQTVIYT